MTYTITKTYYHFLLNALSFRAKKATDADVLLYINKTSGMLREIKKFKIS